MNIPDNTTIFLDIKAYRIAFCIIQLGNLQFDPRQNEQKNWDARLG